MPTQPAAVMYLIRHGSTALDAGGLLRGRSDPALDEVGRHEAAALGALFRDMELAGVVTSPLQRARQTAEPIAAASGTPLRCDDRLADRDYGEWTGVAADEVRRRFGSLDAAPGVEPTGLLVARVIAASEAAADTWPTGVAVVAHDAVNRHAIAALVVDAPDVEDIPQRTGCWNRLERGPAGWVAPIVDAVVMAAVADTTARGFAYAAVLAAAGTAVLATERSGRARVASG